MTKFERDSIIELVTLFRRDGKLPKRLRRRLFRLMGKMTTELTLSGLAPRGK